MQSQVTDVSGRGTTRGSTDSPAPETLNTVVIYYLRVVTAVAHHDIRSVLVPVASTDASGTPPGCRSHV